MINAFENYKEKYVEENAINTYGEFDISPMAVKSAKGAFKSVLKLDKNFHIYIHGNHDMIERGYDEGTQMNYYKVFFTKES